MTSLSFVGDEPRRGLSAGGTVVLALGALDFGLEQSIIVPALPSFVVSYHTSIIGVAWLVTGFLVAAAVAVPLAGRLGDLVGKKRMLLVSLGAFAAGSLVCALTHSIALAIAGRTVQGLGASVAPLTLGLARDIVPAEDLPRMIGAVIGSANVGGGIGFLASGILVDAFSATAIFWFLFIAGVVLFAGVAAFVPESPVRAEASIDPIGAVLLGSGLAALLLAISKGQAWRWGSASIVGLFLGAAVALLAFGLIEGRRRAPLIDLGLVLRQPFRSTSLCAFAFGFTFFLALLVIPQIAASPSASGYGLGLTVTKIGLMLVPTSAAGLLASWLGGRVVDRVGPRVLVASGSVIGAAAYLFMAYGDRSTASLVVASAVLGVAWGLILTGIYPVVLRSAGADRSGVAAAVTLLFRNIGLSVGVTVAAVVIADAGRIGLFPAEHGYTRALLCGAIGTAVTFAVAFLLPRRTTAPS
jgi:MFS family permease